MIYSDLKVFTEDMLDSEMTDTLNEIKFYTIDYLFSYKLMHNRESYELKLYKDIVEMLSDKRQFTYKEYLLINDYYTDFNDSNRYWKYFPRNEHHVYVG